MRVKQQAYGNGGLGWSPQWGPRQMKESRGKATPKAGKFLAFESLMVRQIYFILGICRLLSNVNKYH